MYPQAPPSEPRGTLRAGGRALRHGSKRHRPRGPFLGIFPLPCHGQLPLPTARHRTRAGTGPGTGHLRVSIGEPAVMPTARGKGQR